MRTFSTISPFALRFLAVAGSLFVVGGCQPRAVVPEPEAEPEPKEARVEEPEQVEEPAEPTVSPLAGQVFVIGPSGESIRLGSVRVRVFAEETIETHLEATKQTVAREREELRARLAELEQLVGEREEARAEAEANYEKREREIRARVEELKATLRKETAALQEKIDANAEFIAFSEEFPPPPQGIPTREEFEEYDRRRTQWIEMTPEERRSWIDVLTNLNADLTAKQEQLAADLDEKIQGFADELRALDGKISAAAQAIAATAEEIEVVRSDLNAPVDGDLWLTGLPAPLREVRTDAEGEFAVELEPGRRYVVTARAERQIHGEDAQYSWLVRVGGENRFSRLLLGDHNVTTSDAPENVVEHAVEEADSNT